MLLPKQDFIYLFCSFVFQWKKTLRPGVLEGAGRMDQRTPTKSYMNRSFEKFHKNFLPKNKLKMNRCSVEGEGESKPEMLRFLNSLWFLSYWLEK